MNTNLQNLIKDARVSAVKLASAEYPENDGENAIAAAIRRSAENLGWSDEQRGAFGKLIKEGAKVVVKPNLVLHKNQGKAGLTPLITHQSIVKAVVAEVLKANPSQVLIGDAPIQSCDLEELLRQTKLDQWSAELQKNDARFKGIIDFRRTISTFVGGVRKADEDRRSEENYVRYNLKEDSLL